MPKNTCPNCGKDCTPVTVNPDTPPWLCEPCARGWWQAEIDNGHFWDPDNRSWGSASSTRRVLAACEKEREAQQ